MPIYKINENLNEQVLKKYDSTNSYMSMQKFKSVEIELSSINDTESEEYAQFLEDLKLLKSEFDKLEKECLDKLYKIRWDESLSKEELKKLMHIDCINYFSISDGRYFDITYNGDLKHKSSKFFEYHSANLRLMIPNNSNKIKIDEVGV